MHNSMRTLPTEPPPHSGTAYARMVGWPAVRRCAGTTSLATGADVVKLCPFEPPGSCLAAPDYRVGSRKSANCGRCTQLAG